MKSSNVGPAAKVCANSFLDPELELDAEPAFGFRVEAPEPEEGVASPRTCCVWTRRTEGRIARFSPCIGCKIRVVLCIWIREIEGKLRYHAKVLYRMSRLGKKSQEICSPESPLSRA